MRSFKVQHILNPLTPSALAMINRRFPEALHQHVDQLLLDPVLFKKWISSIDALIELLRVSPEKAGAILEYVSDNSSEYERLLFVSHASGHLAPPPLLRLVTEWPAWADCLIEPALKDSQRFRQLFGDTFHSFMDVLKHWPGSPEKLIRHVGTFHRSFYKLVRHLDDFREITEYLGADASASLLDILCQPEMNKDKSKSDIKSDRFFWNPFSSLADIQYLLESFPSLEHKIIHRISEEELAQHCLHDPDFAERIKALSKYDSAIPLLEAIIRKQCLRRDHFHGNIIKQLSKLTSDPAWASRLKNMLTSDIFSQLATRGTRRNAENLQEIRTLFSLSTSELASFLGVNPAQSPEETYNILFGKITSIHEWIRMAQAFPEYIDHFTTLLTRNTAQFEKLFQYGGVSLITHFQALSPTAVNTLLKEMLSNDVLKPQLFKLLKEFFNAEKEEKEGEPLIDSELFLFLLESRHLEEILENNVHHFSLYAKTFPAIQPRLVQLLPDQDNPRAFLRFIRNANDLHALSAFAPEIAARQINEILNDVRLFSFFIQNGKSLNDLMKSIINCIGQPNFSDAQRNTWIRQITHLVFKDMTESELNQLFGCVYQLAEFVGHFNEKIQLEDPAIMTGLVKMAIGNRQWMEKNAMTYGGIAALVQRVPEVEALLVQWYESETFIRNLHPLDDLSAATLNRLASFMPSIIPRIVRQSVGQLNSVESIIDVIRKYSNNHASLRQAMVDYLLETPGFLSRIDSMKHLLSLLSVLNEEEAKKILPRVFQETHFRTLVAASPEIKIHEVSAMARLISLAPSETTDELLSLLSTHTIPDVWDTLIKNTAPYTDRLLDYMPPSVISIYARYKREALLELTGKFSTPEKLMGYILMHRSVTLATPEQLGDLLEVFPDSETELLAAFYDNRHQEEKQSGPSTACLERDMTVLREYADSLRVFGENEPLANALDETASELRQVRARRDEKIWGSENSIFLESFPQSRIEEKSEMSQPETGVDPDYTDEEFSSFCEAMRQLTQKTGSLMNLFGALSEKIGTSTLMKKLQLNEAITLCPSDESQNVAELRLGLHVMGSCSVSPGKRFNLKTLGDSLARSALSLLGNETWLKAFCKQRIEEIKKGLSEEEKAFYLKKAWFDAIKKADMDTLHRILIEHPEAIHFVESNGNTGLIVAANKAFPKIIQFLLRRGANRDATNSDGHNALMCALLKKNDEECLSGRILLSLPQDLSLADLHGRDALAMAAEEGRAALVKPLCHKMRDLPDFEKRCQTALHLAKSKGWEEVCRILSRTLETLIRKEDIKTLVKQRGYSPVAVRPNDALAKESMMNQIDSQSIHRK